MRVPLPLFPLHTVLCPGVALPLHIFEERYRVMIARCIAAKLPFGVVLIRDGREVGPLSGRVASVGTTAAIRQAERHPDGRYDVVTVGERRFAVDRIDATSEPYLTGLVRFLDEPSGGDAEARRLAERVGRRFLRYLELLQPALATDDGPEIEVEVEVDAPDDVVASEPQLGAEVSDMTVTSVGEPARDRDLTAEGVGIDTSSLSDEQRRDLLMAAARRLITPTDPTALSYLLTGLVQVELPRRQDLLEAPDTVSRLTGLDALLSREIRLLSKDLKPLALDPRASALRRN